MAVTPLSGPHIQAKGYTRARAYREASSVKWLVLHTAEGGSSEKVLGEFFRTHSSGSSNAGVGQGGGYATYVNYGDTPWTNPPLNQESDTLEMLGFAKWGRKEWLAQTKLLDTVARWIAWRAAVRGIPVRFVVSPARGTSGVTGHVQVNDVWHMSSHWDPGPQFPWDYVIDKAQELARVRPPVSPSAPIVVRPGSSYTVRAGDTYWRIAQAAYKDGAKWPTVAQANKNAPLQPGMKLVVPALTAPRSAPVPARIDLPGWPGYGYVAKGKRNGYVEKMQRKLRALGHSKLNPSGTTGYYGDETVAMVKAFQKGKSSLWGKGDKGPDGIAGPKTWEAIDKA